MQHMQQVVSFMVEKLGCMDQLYVSAFIQSNRRVAMYVVDIQRAARLEILAKIKSRSDWSEDNLRAEFKDAWMEWSSTGPQRLSLLQVIRGIDAEAVARDDVRYSNGSFVERTF